MFHIIPIQQWTCEIILQEEIIFIISLSFCFLSVHSLYKYYCWYNCTIIHFYRHFTSLLPPEKIPFLFVFDCSCVHMSLQWKSFFVADYAVFSLHILFFNFLEMLQKYLWRHNLTLLFMIPFFSWINLISKTKSQR